MKKLFKETKVKKEIDPKIIEKLDAPSPLQEDKALGFAQIGTLREFEMRTLLI